MKHEVIEDSGDWLDQYLATGKLPDVPAAPAWTPDLVGEQLVEALRWAKHNAGRVGPGGFMGSRSLFNVTLEDHLEEGWGLPEIAGDDEPDECRRYAMPSPEQITRYEMALQWPADHLLPDHKGSARMLGLWAACEISKRSFSRACRARGVDRRAALQLRDRGLSLISQALHRSGLPVEV